MFKKVLYSLNLLDLRHRVLIGFFAFARSLLGLLDLAGILLIGLLLSEAANLINGNEASNAGKLFGLNFLPNLTLNQLASLAVLAFILKSILSALLTKLMINTLVTAESEITTNLFAKLMHSDLGQINKRSRQDTIYPLNQASSYGITEILSLAVTIISETFLLIIVSVAFAFFNLKITMFILIYFILIGTLIQFVVGRSYHYSGKKYANSIVLAGNTLENSLNAFREIKTSKTENFFIKNFSKNKKDSAEALGMIQFVSALPRYIVESALIIGALGLTILSTSQGSLDKTAQTLGIFLTGGLRIMASMLPLQNAVGAMKQLLAKSEKFFEFERELKVYEASGNSKKPTFKGPVGIRFSNIFFTYEDSSDFAIKNFNLEIDPGSVIAIVGPSGSGKSTLADLALGMLKTQKGKVSYWKSESVECKLEDISVSYVPQSPGLISGSILENVAFGVSPNEIDLSRVNRALDLANLYDFVENLPHKLETKMNETLTSLSGGQIQRIGLARVFYNQPSLIVLDEATSALDAETESVITSAVNGLKGLCTTIIIAHRISTVKSCDSIIVLENGVISGIGDFKSLSVSNATFSRYLELSKIELRDS